MAAIYKVMTCLRPLTRTNFGMIKKDYRRFCSSVAKPESSAAELPVATPDVSGLMEFFDEPKNWGQMGVKVGRAWRKEELRIKSNSDLHKLWYVLLKERNMLLTMEYNCNKDSELFPNPERLDKVEESMEFLEDVIRERNKAYYELETQETGEAPTVDLQTPRGKLMNREIKEYPIPKHQNVEWQKDQVVVPAKEFAWFNARLREQEHRNKIKETRSRRRELLRLLRRFPDIDTNYLQELYPEFHVLGFKKSTKSKFW